MPHALLIALIVFAVAVAVGLVAATVRGLQLWRDFRAFRRTVLRRLDKLNGELAMVERRSAKAAGSTVALERAHARLRQTLEIASLVRGAAAESWSLFRLVRDVVPRK